MTFTISEAQLLQWVFAYIAIHFAILYLAIKWWSPTETRIVVRDRYIPAPLPVAENHTEELCLPEEPSVPLHIPTTVPVRQAHWKLIDDCISALVKLGHKQQDARRIVLNVVDKDDTVESVIAKAYAKPKAT